jgi:acyl-CoA reductase-like NAD-dependent aldehyde dehydrogenase
MLERKVLPFINPATCEQFGQVAMALPEEVQQAVGELRLAQRDWSQKSVRERGKAMRKFLELMLDEVDEISAVITQDCGKSRQDALIEVFMTADLLYQYLKYAPRWLDRRTVPRGVFYFKRAYVEMKPYGVVGVIAPWNYPFALAMPPVLTALLAGNTVVLKPSEVTAPTGVMIERLFQRVPELAPYVRVVHGDGDVGAALIEAGPDYIFLTGSPSTGKKVLKAAAERLIPVACELGGKDAMLVLDDADIDQAARWGVWGAFYNTGQTCMSAERVYVADRVYDEFLEKSRAYMREMKIGFTQNIDCPYHCGPMTDPRQIMNIERHLEDALAKGARVLEGGQRQGMYIQPAILVDVDHSMLVMQEETFGPLMPIVRVKDEAEAIRLANDCVYGLGASVWSRDIRRAERVAHQLETGSVIINDTISHFGAPMLPFGGIKQSGSARIHGKEGFMQFTRPHSYLVGQSPKEWDIATLMRKPGHYYTGADIMRLYFGATLKQRLQPVLERLGLKPRQE